MHERQLDVLGQTLIDQARDPSITEADNAVSGRMKDASSQRIFGRLRTLDSEQMEAVHALISDVVDLVLHNVLWMFERAETFQIGMDTEADPISDIREVALGELQGYLYDWIPRFSQQRYEPPA